MKTCYKCKGSGEFIGYSGRVLGKCYTCNGTGELKEDSKPNESAKEQQPQLMLPNILSLLQNQNIRLTLQHCKVVQIQSGAILVVGHVFGSAVFGNINTRSGAFKPYRACTKEVTAELQDIEQRGIEAAKEIGRLTGVCCVCGRTLTNEDSIEDGIGPICAGKLGG